MKCAFVPPRPRDRRRLKKGDSRAGYWCRRTATLEKKLATACREAHEAKQATITLTSRVNEMEQLLAIPLRMGPNEWAPRPRRQ